MENKTHFKKLLNPIYLGSHDLEPNKEYKVTIDRIQQDVEVIGDGGKKQKKAICHFKGASKPMILNATNMKMISVVLGSKFIEDWIGKSVSTVTRSGLTRVQALTRPPSVVEYISKTCP